MTSLQAAVRALGVSADPSPFRTTNRAGTRGLRCGCAALAVRGSSAVPGPPAARSSRSGWAPPGRPARLASSGWPTVRLHLSGGASPVAKRFEYAPALRSMTAALTSYRHAGTEPTVLTLARQVDPDSAAGTRHRQRHVRRGGLGDCLPVSDSPWGRADNNPRTSGSGLRGSPEPAVLPAGSRASVLGGPRAEGGRRQHGRRH